MSPRVPLGKRITRDDDGKIWNVCKICGSLFQFPIDDVSLPDCRYVPDFRAVYCSDECRKTGERESKRERMQRYRQRLHSIEFTTYASTPAHVQVGLSIDYDFFLTDRKLEKQFWSQLGKRHLKPTVVVYDDDHKNAYYLFKDVELDVLIHFDNHSDCFDKNLSSITTENWLLKLMQAKPRLKVIWIQNKNLASQIGLIGTEERSVIHVKNWIEPPFCFKEVPWEYDAETKEHFIDAKSPQMLELMEVWTQLDKAIELAGIKKPNVVGCFVSRSPPWTKDRTVEDFHLFLERSHVRARKTEHFCVAKPLLNE